MQNTTHTIQTYQDQFNNVFVKDIPLDLFNELVAASLKVSRLEEIVISRLGKHEVKKAEMARILGVSQFTIDSWKTREGYLKEGIHFRTIGEKNILYDVQNMKDFRQHIAKEEKLREEAKQAQEKIYEIQVKLNKRAKRK